MKFEFNSLDELDGFVQYLFKAREHGARVAGMSPALDAPYDENATPDALTAALDTVTNAALDIARATGTLPVPDAGARQTVREWAEGEVRTNVAPQTEPEPPKRKRRTKAEIEADKAAAAAGALTDERPDTNAPSDAQATAATSPLAGANPFDASTSNAPAATAALSEAPAGTTGTLSALGGSDARADAQAAADGEGATPVDPQAFIELRVAEMGGAFDAREHMKKCVEFIGALGKVRYDEAFDLAGTSRSVATYSPADCAKHIAALEYLQLSGKGA